MSKSNKGFENTKNKFTGKFKEAAGKVTGNEQLELKGKIQSSKADLKKNLSVKAKIEDIKEGIAEKVNDSIDKSKMKKRKNR